MILACAGAQFSLLFCCSSYHRINGDVIYPDEFACEMKVTVAVTFLVGVIQVIGQKITLGLN